MNNFTFYAPTMFAFGQGEASRVGALVRQFGGSKVLLVAGGGSVKKNGAYDAVAASLKEAGFPWCELWGVQANPRSGKVYEGIDLARTEGVDFLLAIGGGSVIDTCKAIAHGAANPGTDIWEFWKRRAPLTRSMPVGVVLTIPAAGSETSDSAVLTNAEAGEKRGLNTPFNRPAFAILDPLLAATLPVHQVACGVSDILMHTLDRYFNPVTDNDLTDELAEALLRYHRGVTFLSGNTITPLIFNAFARVNLEFWSDYVHLEGIARSLHTLSRFTKLIEAGEGDAAAELLRQGLERFRAALCQ